MHDTPSAPHTACHGAAGLRSSKQQQRQQRATVCGAGAHVAEVFAQQLEDAALPVEPGGQVVDLDPLPHEQDRVQDLLGLACHPSVAVRSGVCGSLAARDRPWVHGSTNGHLARAIARVCEALHPRTRRRPGAAAGAGLTIEWVDVPLRIETRSVACGSDHGWWLSPEDRLPR